MKFASAFVLGIPLLFLAAPPLAPQAGPAFDVRKLAWLAGTWEKVDGERVTQEHWLPFKGSTMIGVSHTYDAKATRFFEFLRIAVQGDTVAYVAQPGGGEPVPFLMKEQTDTLAVFENAEHDHPQRIRYERTLKGMTATVSLLDGTRAQSFVFARKAD